MRSAVIRLIPFLALMTLMLSVAWSAPKKSKKAPPTDNPETEVLVPVSPNFLKQHNISGDSLKGLQYYSDYTITLVRLVTPADERLASGKLVIVSGRNYEIVVVQSRTPGIATSASESEGVVRSISISFEPHCTMEFRPLNDDTSNFTVRNSVEYCGFRYKMAECTYNEREELNSIGVGVSKDHCGSDLYVAYKPGKATGNVRVVPGRTLAK